MNLTQEEYKQLRAIKVLIPAANWLARDFNIDSLSIYNKKPKRGIYGFLGERIEINCFYSFEKQNKCNKILPFVCWEYEPFNINLLLEDRELEINRKLLSKLEKEQILEITVRYPWGRWVARDFDGDLYVYHNKPKRNGRYFTCSDLTNIYAQIPHIYLDFITWDGEPFDITGY